MMKFRLAIFASALVGASAAFAQQTPPAKPITQGTQPAKTPQQPSSQAARGGMSAGAGQSAAPVAAGAATTQGLIGMGAALVVTVGVAAQPTTSH